MFAKHFQIYINRVFEGVPRQFHVNRISYNKCDVKYKNHEDSYLKKLIEEHKNRIIFNTFIEDHYPILSPTKNNYAFRKRLKYEEKKLQYKVGSVEPLPVVLKQFSKINDQSEAAENVSVNTETTNITHFPYGDQNTVPIVSANNQQLSSELVENVADRADKEVKTRHELYSEIDYSKWMTDYENYEELQGEDEHKDRWKINYGTPDPKSSISNIPCGGCGALLHCKDSAIPGYIPSEIYKNSRKREGVHLKAIKCQRCHFLENYNLALQVRVTSEDYPKVLETIKEKRALIILIVDLVDFPCSIWPGIKDLIGRKKPIVVVGNKVDLLPRDSRGYLEHVKTVLKTTVRELMGKETAADIKHVALISATTGWGIEELITKLHNMWSTQGDVYLVGCTNVGKSSLFNSLLQSDYCKIQAVDLVQRATTSLWPGTTLNLLKFPILRPSGWRLYIRTKRLQSLNKLKATEAELNKIQLGKTNDPKYATLTGHLDRTFGIEVPEKDPLDPFAVHASATTSGKTRVGIDDNDRRFATGKWCYDTPGVVQPDQIIHLLTTEELVLTLPRELIQPKTFGVRVGQTLFIAGLGRLDYIEGPRSVRLTVFCAEGLPITVCDTENAELLYKQFLGSEVLQVPKGSEERLNKWPGLKAAEPFKLTLKDKYTSCGDIVLSNAGWVAVNGDRGHEVVFKGWTPEARGVYLRKSILPNAVALRGKKIRGSPAYMSNKFYIPK